jgi:hypothetical protein
MFRVVVLQCVHTLSDDRTEYQLKDQLSFMRFVGLALHDPVPDAKTIWLYREQLARPAITPWGQGWCVDGPPGFGTLAESASVGGRLAANAVHCWSGNSAVVPADRCNARAPIGDRAALAEWGAQLAPGLSVLFAWGCVLAAAHQPAQRPSSGSGSSPRLLIGRHPLWH